MSSKKDHGTASSYVIGFVLSLIFTIIPYHLVVNKVMSGNSLLLAILVIAVIQMFIQIFFFLHLGRGPKPLYNVVFFFATAGLIIVVVGASMFIMENLYRNMSPKELVLKQAQNEGIDQLGGTETGACQEIKQNHIVTISNSVASPSFTQAQRCDTLTFVNQEARDLKIIFGPQNQAKSYGGMYEIDVSDRRPETFTLNESGSFIFSDSADPGITGSFSVAP